MVFTYMIMSRKIASAIKNCGFVENYQNFALVYVDPNILHVRTKNSIRFNLLTHSICVQQNTYAVIRDSFTSKEQPRSLVFSVST